MADPFADDPVSKPAPKVEQADGWVSFTFNSAPGYDRIGATVHGAPEFVANAFGVKDFNGKISTLMAQAVKVDEYFKKQYGGASSGKA